MAKGRCPICKRPVGKGPEGERYVPFCSRRCQLIDLGVWLEEGYRVQAEEQSPGEDRAEEQSGPEEPQE